MNLGVRLQLVFVVAICELQGAVEAEAAALAKDLGTTAYEERLGLVGGMPAIVGTFAERAEATSLLQKIRARGHGVVGFDGDAVVSTSDMVTLRSLSFEPDALVTGDQRLSYSDILAILRATHKKRTDTTSEVKERQFSVGRAVLTGGLMMSKTKTKEEQRTVVEHDQLVYLFRSSGETPWVISERGVNFQGLGAELSPSRAQNLMTTLAKLRALAPAAAYDERLLLPRALSARVQRSATLTGEKRAQSSADAVDLLAHVIALWIRKRASG